MKKIFYLLSFAAVLSIASCKKKTCDQECKNGASCVNGECQCPTGFSGPDCSAHNNPCDTTLCYYGGVCLNGVCQCPGHTSGTHCEILQQPTMMYIIGVTVNHFSPAAPNSIPWDDDRSGDGGTPIQADIYPVIRRNGTVIYNGYNQDTLYSFKRNANYDTQFKFVFHSDSIAVTDVTNPDYQVELWDYDDGVNPDDSMFSFKFKPWTGIDGFPGSFSYHDTTGFAKQFDFRVNYYENNNNYVW